MASPWLITLAVLLGLIGLGLVIYYFATRNNPPTPSPTPAPVQLDERVVVCGENRYYITEGKKFPLTENAWTLLGASEQGKALRPDSALCAKILEFPSGVVSINTREDVDAIVARAPIVEIAGNDGSVSCDTYCSCTWGKELIGTNAGPYTGARAFGTNDPLAGSICPCRLTNEPEWKWCPTTEGSADRCGGGIPSCPPPTFF